MKIIGKKATLPPLGLLTVAAMLPKKWPKKLVDMNAQELKDDDLRWADLVFLSAMIVQKESVQEVIKRAKKMGKTIVAGGPLFTTGWEEFSEVDHLVLGEAEETLPLFLKDWQKGRPQKIYSSQKFPEIRKAPIPDWSLLDLHQYTSMCIQYSRGCPFNCEFCDIVMINGRVPRTKSKKQLLNELEALYSRGWREAVFFVDDNFIGNKERLKKEILPVLIAWQKKRRQPFVFNTQVSINLADDPKLMKLMVRAGFNAVFIGIETPNPQSLEECHKFQNKNRDLVQAIKTIQKAGLEVQAGFIVGFDHDTSSIFQRQIEFIQQSGIGTAMVGLLSALPKTRLYQRLKETGRLIKESAGSNTLMDLNFIPKMDVEILRRGYKQIMTTIYSPKHYYQRILTFLKEFNPPLRNQPLRLFHLRILLSSFWYLGIMERGRRYFWKLVLWSLIKRPDLFSYAIASSITGLHFRKLYHEKM